MVFAAFLMLSLLTVLTGLGVFSEKFQDNLMQRCGLVLMCMGALSTAWRLWSEAFLAHSALTLLLGLTVFAIGSTIKSCRKWPTQVTTR